MNTNSHQFEIFEATQQHKVHNQAKKNRAKTLATVAAVLLILTGAYYLGASSVRAQHKSYSVNGYSNWVPRFLRSNHQDFPTKLERTPIYPPTA